MFARSLTREETAELLRDTDHFLLVPHVSPDPDSLGSAIGLALLLAQLGKEAWVYTPDPIPFDSQFLARLVPVLSALPSGGPWHAIALDYGDPKRLPPNSRLESVWLNIDHHLDNHHFATYTWVNERAAATTELVAQLGEELGIPFSAPCATALYAGLLYDTRGFVSDQTNPETHRLAAKLVAAGAMPRMIHHELNEQLRPSAVRVMGMALADLHVDCAGAVIWTAITQRMLNEAEAHEDETDLILSELPRVAQAEVMVLFKEVSGGVKVSLRSRGQVDIHAIAKRFGGGGHRLACGILLPLCLQEAVRQILEAVYEALPGVCLTRS